jgi:preprotein translocase subunit SecB
MKAAPIQLTNYFVSELQFAANRGFKADSPTNVSADDLQVMLQPLPKEGNNREWQITLRVALNAAPESNSPYNFMIEMIGFITVAPSVAEIKIERFARINGTSLIFAAAREIVRAATARGPFNALLLPTVTFWEPPPGMPTSAQVNAETRKEEEVPRTKSQSDAT